MPENKTFSVRLGPLLPAVRRRAALEGVSIGEIVRKAVLRYLEGVR